MIVLRQRARALTTVVYADAGQVPSQCLHFCGHLRILKDWYMEKSKLSLSIIVMIVMVALSSCNKEKLASAISNSGPCNCGGNSLTSFQVSVKKINNYPAGSKIYIERIGYPGSDSSKIYNSVVLEKALPFNDTTLTQVEIKNYTQYIKWKVSAVNNDSLSGGSTTKLTTGDNPILFEVSY